MADEDIYIARLGSWLARATSQAAEFAGDLQADAIGFQLPDALVTNPQLVAAAAAVADAGTTLSSGADALDAAVTSGDEGQLASALLKLVEGVYHLIDSSTHLVDAITAAAAGLAGDDRTAVESFATVLARRLIDFLVISRLEIDMPRLVFLLDLMGIIERTAVPASGAAGEPDYVLKVLHLERFGDFAKDPGTY